MAKRTQLDYNKNVTEFFVFDASRRKIVPGLTMERQLLVKTFAHLRLDAEQQQDFVAKPKLESKDKKPDTDDRSDR